jgi:hypothetical protein
MTTKSVRMHAISKLLPTILPEPHGPDAAPAETESRNRRTPPDQIGDRVLIPLGFR